MGGPLALLYGLRHGTSNVLADSVVTLRPARSIFGMICQKMPGR